MISWTDLLNSAPCGCDNLRYSDRLDHLPRIVVWNITSACNLHCRHCYYASSDKSHPDELNEKEAFLLIEDLARVKAPIFLLSGGEPLLRKDVFAIARFAKDKGMKVALSTNGTLITEEIAGRIKEAGFYYVGISLDGMQNTNNAFRQNEAAFKKSIEGIRNCQKLGLKAGLRFTLTKYNFKDLADIFDLVESESVQRLCIYHLVYTGRGSDISEMDLDREEKRGVLELIWLRTREFIQKRLNIEVLTVNNHADGAWLYLKLNRINPGHGRIVLQMLKFQGGNSSGVKIGAVDDRGNVYPDQFFKSHPLGNIRQKAFSDIWLDEDNTFLQALRNRRPLLKGRCQRCKFVTICNGNFRARAEAAFGDIWAEDPACYLSESEIHGDESALDILGDDTGLQPGVSALQGSGRE